ncbi:hypothetical protein [Cesiribacter sp. SM1]|uniref:hypothetical protein n=1 Tax=Cesiribacter sp. SM1 TaxID=2861196 RepID=UPI001CD53E45|nr:hypothetical protein [Cesiribacter sp. SM1]
MLQEIKKLQWLVLLPVIAFLCNSCDPCRSEELPLLQVVMQFQQERSYVLRSDLLEGRRIWSNEILQLPFALNSDTTVYEFLDMRGKIWRLALTYDRISDFEDTGCGFFMELRNVRVLPESTFSDVQIQDNSSSWTVIVTE